MLDKDLLHCPEVHGLDHVVVGAAFVDGPVHGFMIIQGRGNEYLCRGMQDPHSLGPPPLRVWPGWPGARR